MEKALSGFYGVADSDLPTLFNAAVKDQEIAICKL
jgi:hypothetical protein